MYAKYIPSVSQTKQTKMNLVLSKYHSSVYVVKLSTLELLNGQRQHYYIYIINRTCVTLLYLFFLTINKGYFIDTYFPTRKDTFMGDQF